MIPFIIEQFKENQILQAAVVAAPLATLSWAARSVPASLWTSIKKLSSLEISFNSDMADYQEILEYVTENIVNQRFSRNFSYHAERAWDDTIDQHITHHSGLRLGYGVHWGSYKRRWVIVRRELMDGQQTEKFKERLFVTVISFRLKTIRDFSADLAYAVAKKTDERFITLYVNNKDYWRTVGKLPVRSMDTVFTSENQKHELLEHLQLFEASRESYRKKGIPWHTGALLTGPPGTGKTSLIQVMASELGRSIHYLSLGSIADDGELTALMSDSRNWHSSILVIEDADAATDTMTDRELKSETRAETITLSTILNVLDGLLTPDGMIVIATTNHLEKLDAALLRSGRFDLALHLDFLEAPEFRRMAELFELPEKEIAALLKDYVPISGAEARNILLEKLDGRVSR